MNVFDVFVKFLTLVQNQFNCTIRALQCDNGGEFRNQRLTELFSKAGIVPCFFLSSHISAERSRRTFDSYSNQHGSLYSFSG